MMAAEVDRRAVTHGQLVKERRLDLGLNRPAFVAQMEKHGQEITPDYLNKLERGTAPLSRASLEVREAIRAVLGYSAEEWQELIGLFTPAPTPTPAERQGWRVPPSTPDIPAGLLEAARLYGKEHPGLTTEAWQRELAELDFREEPETPEDWLAVYSRLSKLINPRS